MNDADAIAEEAKKILDAHRLMLETTQARLRGVLADLRDAEELIAVGKTHAGHLAILKILTETKV